MAALVITESGKAIVARYHDGAVKFTVDGGTELSGFTLAGESPLDLLEYRGRLWLTYQDGLGVPQRRWSDDLGATWTLLT